MTVPTPVEFPEGEMSVAGLPRGLWGQRIRPRAGKYGVLSVVEPYSWSGERRTSCKTG